MSFTTPNSMNVELPSPVAVACHDAGAANLILAGLGAGWAREWRACAEGPARRRFLSLFPDHAVCATLVEALRGAAALLSGTGWASSLEHEARRLAREMGVFSVAVVDHWVNYPDRFVRNGEQVWPDEFWVTDVFAEDLARDAFPGREVRRVPNHYFEQQLRDIRPAKSADTTEILYVPEPAQSDWGRGVPGEFQALDYFISCLNERGLSPMPTIRLRPHPSDPPGKYDAWLAANAQHPVMLDDAQDLAAALSRADWVVGCETAAMVLALESGRTVYCSLPPWAPPCRLPHPGILPI